MRISTPQINFNGIEGFRKHTEDLYKIQENLSSGKRVNKPGDDPVAAARIYTLDKSIKQLDQWNVNGAYAQTKLEIEDTALTNFTDVMQRIRELTIYGMNDTQNTNGRQAIAAEMRGLLENLKSLANTQDSNGEYIFSGDKSTTPAYQAVTAANVTQLSTGLSAPQPTNYFTVAATAGTVVPVQLISSPPPAPPVNITTTQNNQIVDNFNGKIYTLNATTQAYEDAQGEPLYAYTGAHSGARFVQISPDNDRIDNANDKGDASRVRVSDMGAKTFGNYSKTSATPWQPAYDSTKNPQLNYNIFDTMRELVSQFETGQSGTGATAGNTRLDDFLAEIDTAMESVRQTQADVGTRLQRIDMQNAMNQDFKLGLTNNLALLRDQDMVTGINQYQKILTSLQMSQQTFAKLSELSLFNYIR
jgi:flagellar hook-associated protein 3 FlgL